MAYQALYRVFRPQSFQDVVGQEHVTKTLKNAIVQNKTSHAYLFSGPRGGKLVRRKFLRRRLTVNTAMTGSLAMNVRFVKVRRTVLYQMFLKSMLPVITGLKKFEISGKK
ncbi:DNA polymerase III subunit gamma/tau [Listeria monocytogenes N53-1]|nr:DNA polymerase III subunit gamma/tau [Listeria monocytogenes N53-1]